ncbi:hypothetical protein GB937_000430 [Aspergillus fischeri]|nr:hypothetical protein GB937_000430 [Aspergillus fischeri]
MTRGLLKHNDQKSEKQMGLYTDSDPNAALGIFALRPVELT